MRNVVARRVTRGYQSQQSQRRDDREVLTRLLSGYTVAECAYMFNASCRDIRRIAKRAGMSL